MGLQTDRHVNRAGTRGGSHLDSFATITPERPLAIHMLFRRKRRQNQVAVIRHPDAHRDDVDVGRRHQSARIVVGRRTSNAAAAASALARLVVATAASCTFSRLRSAGM